jgi:hypothetical protein
MTARRLDETLQVLRGVPSDTAYFVVSTANKPGPYMFHRISPPLPVEDNLNNPFPCLSARRHQTVMRWPDVYWLRTTVRSYDAKSGRFLSPIQTSKYVRRLQPDWKPCRRSSVPTLTWPSWIS